MLRHRTVGLISGLVLLCAAGVLTAQRFHQYAAQYDNFLSLNSYGPDLNSATNSESVSEQAEAIDLPYAYLLDALHSATAADGVTQYSVGEPVVSTAASQESDAVFALVGSGEVKVVSLAGEKPAIVRSIRLAGYPDDGRAASMSSDGQYVAVISNSNNILIWKIGRTTRWASPITVAASQLSSDSKHFVHFSENNILVVTGGGDIVTVRPMIRRIECQEKTDIGEFGFIDAMRIASLDYASCDPRGQCWAERLFDIEACRPVRYDKLFRMFAKSPNVQSVNYDSRQLVQSGERGASISALTVGSAPVAIIQRSAGAMNVANPLTGRLHVRDNMANSSEFVSATAFPALDIAMIADQKRGLHFLDVGGGSFITRFKLPCAPTKMQTGFGGRNLVGLCATGGIMLFRLPGMPSTTMAQRAYESFRAARRISREVFETYASIRSHFKFGDPAQETDTGRCESGGGALNELEATAKGLHWPLPVSGIVSGFFDPSNQKEGVDFSADPDGVVRAVSDGTVAYAGYLRGYDQLIIIKHSHDVLSAYANDLSPRVAEGDRVVTGQVIAVLKAPRDRGSARLHFQVRVGGTPVNPCLALQLPQELGYTRPLSGPLAAGGVDLMPSRTTPDGVNRLRDPTNILSKRSIYFKFDSLTVADEYKPLIEAHAAYLKANRNVKIVLQGNADESGTREYNIALGLKRAEAVKHMMNILGVREASVESISFGQEKPRNKGHDEATRAENRRVDIIYFGE